ncbi:YceI family protein [Cognatiyoonia sp. IB215446]|uniref:YceI family protein n=1 Tax=Cognatiyoonia sp. IB215446 TaxID=3097355 RepID=UPI002A0ACE3B|nr:YceI family protein [Cognatiyoonia sp. IB215446]MDX8350657.1 YceI family protein [Cognatiyoonia sp. IB215446]
MWIKPAITSFLCLLGTSTLAQQSWVVDHSQSTLAFTVSIGGADANGRFEDWTAAISYDPTSPADGAVAVMIDIASVVIDDPRAQAIADAAWLGAEAYPQAFFASDSFALSNATQLSVPGSLTLKGISLPLTLSGSLTVEDCNATAQIRGVLDRTQYGIGVGQAAVAPKVTVSASLIAQCAPN